MLLPCYYIIRLYYQSGMICILAWRAVPPTPRRQKQFRLNLAIQVVPAWTASHYYIEDIRSRGITITRINRVGLKGGMFFVIGC